MVLQTRKLLLTLALIGCWIIAAWGLARGLIVRKPLDRADVIVVLSGSATYQERTFWAAELYRAGLGNKIVLTNDSRQGGWSKAEERNPYFYERAYEQLRLQGIPTGAIEVLPDPVFSTYDEALLLRRFANTRGLHSVMLVTSAYHSRRTLWTLRRVLEGDQLAIGIEPVPPGWQTPPPLTWWLSLRGWQVVPLEYVKLLYYWGRYSKVS